MRLLCSGSLGFRGSLWGPPATGTPLGAGGAGRGSGCDPEQGTLPVFGVMGCPCGCGREAGTNGDAEGWGCCAPRSCSGSPPALPVLPLPGWGCTLGSPLQTGKSLVAPVPTQLQPCANKPLITQPRGEVFFPLFFPPVFPAGPTGICVRIWEPALDHLGCPGGAQALSQEGFPKVGQILGSQEQSAARHPLLFAFFAFSKIKTGKLLVPFPWTLPCPREPGSSWGSPAFTFCKIRAVFYLLFFF